MANKTLRRKVALENLENNLKLFRSKNENKITRKQKLVPYEHEVTRMEKEIKILKSRIENEIAKA